MTGSSKRIDTQMVIWFRPEGESEIKAVASNLSENGLFIATDVDIGVGARLDLRLALSRESGPLEIRGEVKWTREQGQEGEEVLPAGHAAAALLPALLRACAAEGDAGRLRLASGGGGLRQSAFGLHRLARAQRAAHRAGLRVQDLGPEAVRHGRVEAGGQPGDARHPAAEAAAKAL